MAIIACIYRTGTNYLYTMLTFVFGIPLGREWVYPTDKSFTDT